MNKVFLTLLSLALLTSDASADSLLCAKKTAAVKNGKVTLSKIFKTSSSTCPKGTIQIFKDATTAETLTALQGVDGTGSQLDADTLDGLSKESFALASDITTAQSSIDSLSTTSASHTASIASLTASVTSNNTSISTLDTSVSGHDTRIDAVESETRVQNVVRVGVAGGDFTSLATAVSSLSSPSLVNPYLIIVGPGTYTLATTLTVPAGVTIAGAGIDRTIISASRNSGTFSSAAVLNLSGGASITNLTVQNTSTAGSSSCLGIYSSGNTESGRLNFANFQTVIKGVRVKLAGSGAASHYGIVFNAADGVIRDSIVDVDGSTTLNTGIHLQTGGTNLIYVYDSNVYCSSTATTSRGIALTDIAGGNPQLQAINTKIYSDLIGIYLTGAGASAKVLNSLITTNISTGIALQAVNGTMVVNNSTLDAGNNTATSGTGNITCAFITELGGGGHASTCS